MENEREYHNYIVGDNITKKNINYFKNLRKPQWKGVANLTTADLSKILHESQFIFIFI